MDIGLIISFLIGAVFIFLGIYYITNRDWQKKDIKKWASEPKTIARITDKITECSSDGGYGGIVYRADILINGVWYKAESIDNFFGKTVREIGDEVDVAYKPKKSSAATSFLMNTMTEVLLGENRIVDKPTYWFKFLDAKVYENEKKKGIGTSVFFICFGSVIILMAYLACLGII